MKRYFMNDVEYDMPDWHERLFEDMKSIEYEINSRDLAGEIRMNIWNLLDQNIVVHVNGNTYRMEEDA